MAEPKENKSRVSMAALKTISTTRSMHALGRSMSRVRMRKQSYGFSGVPGIRPIERTSQVGLEYKRPPLIYLNTYQLEPHEPWNGAMVTKATANILEELFTGHKYNPQESPALALRIAGELMRVVKSMNFNRYRVIAVVTLMQKRSQSYNNAISFLWDYERDNYVDMQREETTALIQATVFGIYLD